MKHGSEELANKCQGNLVSLIVLSFTTVAVPLNMQLRVWVAASDKCGTCHQLTNHLETSLLQGL